MPSSTSNTPDQPVLDLLDRALVPLSADSDPCRATITQDETTLTCRRIKDHIALSHHDPDRNAHWLDGQVAYMLENARGERTQVSAGHLSGKLGEAGLTRSNTVRRRGRPADRTTGFRVTQGDEHHALVAHCVPTARAARFTSPEAGVVTAALGEEAEACRRYTQVITNLGYRVTAVQDPQQPTRTAHLIVTKSTVD